MAKKSWASTANFPVDGQDEIWNVDDHILLQNQNTDALL